MIKKMHFRALMAFFLLINSSAFAQSDEEGVKAVVNALFEGMKKGDTALLRSAFAPGGVLQTVIKNREGEVKVMTEPLDSFVVAVGRPHTEVYDERIRFETVKIDGDLAIAWTPYKFFIGEKFSHCGVNSFQLVKLKGQWKIQYIIDTRRRAGCE